MSEEPEGDKSLISRQESEDCGGCAEGSFVGPQAARIFSSKVNLCRKPKISLDQFEASRANRTTARLHRQPERLQTSESSLSFPEQQKDQ